MEWSSDLHRYFEWRGPSRQQDRYPRSAEFNRIAFLGVVVMQNTVQVVVPGVIGRIGQFRAPSAVLLPLVALIAIRVKTAAFMRQQYLAQRRVPLYDFIRAFQESSDWSTALLPIALKESISAICRAGPLKVDFITISRMASECPFHHRSDSIHRGPQGLPSNNFIQTSTHPGL